jgi:hypothetical protein
VYAAVEMVRSGRGLETYHTSSLVEFNWIGFLEKKYGGRDHIA